MVESLQPSDASLTGAPVLSARLGYELNLPRVQVKLGGSGLHGPAQRSARSRRLQKMCGGDLRVFVAGAGAAGEYVRIDEDEGLGPKTTALGTFPLASGFHAPCLLGAAGVHRARRRRRPPARDALRALRAATRLVRGLSPHHRRPHHRGVACRSVGQPDRQGRAAGEPRAGGRARTSPTTSTLRRWCTNGETGAGHAAAVHAARRGCLGRPRHRRWGHGRTGAPAATAGRPRRCRCRWRCAHRRTWC